MSYSKQQQESYNSALANSTRLKISRRVDPDEPALITDETQVSLDQLTGKLKQRLAFFGDEEKNDREIKTSRDGMHHDGARRCGSDIIRRGRMDEANVEVVIQAIATV